MSQVIAYVYLCLEKEKKPWTLETLFSVKFKYSFNYRKLLFVLLLNDYFVKISVVIRIMQCTHHTSPGERPATIETIL